MSIVVVIISLVLLITLHELGHFYFAKKFDVEVEEFGIGIPPRLFGKKIGETIYSVNLLPLGGFVRMVGEDEKVKNPRSFSEKPIWQRAIILIAGVVSFWLVAVFIFATVSFGWGFMTEVPEEAEADSFLFVNFIEEDFENGFEIQDTIKRVNGREVVTVNEFKEAVEDGEKVTIVRGSEEKEIDISEMGNIADLIEVRRVAMERMNGLEAASFGVSQTVNVTRLQAGGLWMALRGAVTGEGLPEGMEIGGPIMIGGMAVSALDRSLGDYLMFVGIIATVLAFMNILPIPALDGGRLLFLLVEKIKGGPIPQEVEQKINAVFFLLLISLMLVITARDFYLYIMH